LIHPPTIKKFNSKPMPQLTVFVSPDNVISFSVSVTDGAGTPTNLSYYPDFQYYPPQGLQNPDKNHIGDQFAQVNGFVSATSFPAKLSITTSGGGSATAHFDIDGVERATSLTATWKKTDVQGNIT
jgi:hypothetical protein